MNRRERLNKGRTLETERVLLRNGGEDVAQFDGREGVLAGLAALLQAANALHAVAERLAIDACKDAVHARERWLDKD